MFEPTSNRDSGLEWEPSGDESCLELYEILSATFCCLQAVAISLPLQLNVWLCDRVVASQDDHRNFVTWHSDPPPPPV
jgi:hypothetical protein